MNVTVAVAAASIRAAGAVSPRWGSALAMPLFAAVAKPRPVDAADDPTMSRARHSTLRVAGVTGRGADLAVYDWGRGDRTIVLAHGWNGRASQFATLVRELVAAGCHVVAFDAPAHGASTGRRTYLIDWIDALAELQRRHGAFEAVVGHSFGGLAAVIAAADGLVVRRIVTVAAPADAETLLTQFQRGVGYSARITPALRRRFIRRYFPGETDPFPRLSAAERVLPTATRVLVVHDEADRTVPFGDAERIAAAHPGARTLATTGLGHSRVLRADVFLDAVLEFVDESAEPAAVEVAETAVGV